MSEIYSTRKTVHSCRSFCNKIKIRGRHSWNASERRRKLFSAKEKRSYSVLIKLEGKKIEIKRYENVYRLQKWKKINIELSHNRVWKPCDEDFHYWPTTCDLENKTSSSFYFLYISLIQITNKSIAFLQAKFWTNQTLLTKLALQLV